MNQTHTPTAEHPVPTAVYLQYAEQLLQQIEAVCDHLNDNHDVDIDNQRTGGMLTLTFSQGSQIVINLQKPLQEVWLAAQAGGFHFRLDPHLTWQDTKGSGEFWQCLQAQVLAQSGCPHFVPL